MFAITRQLLEGNFVLAFILPDINQGSDDADSLFVKAFHRFQFVKKHEIAVIATVFLQFLILERIDEMQLHQSRYLVTVEVDGVVADENVIVQKFLIVDFVVAVFGHAFHLLDE